MKYSKTVIDHIEHCYALTRLERDGRPFLAAAGEKEAPCRIYTPDGVCTDQVWDSPGGVMTMVPVPGGNGTFLATQRFYSPDDSGDAALICARKQGNTWQLTKILDIPHIHRFDIIPGDGVNHVIACTLKSGQDFPGDWSHPGCIWTGVLPDDPSDPLDLTVFRSGLTHHHGYSRLYRGGKIDCVISCDEGVFLVSPPAAADGGWTMKQLLDVPCSDAVMIDLDGDGELEIFTIRPFHGDTIAVWHLQDGIYRAVYVHPEKLPFLHAIAAGTVYQRPTVFTGNREGGRMFLAFYYDRRQAAYRYEVIDRDTGPANCMLFTRDGHPALLATNREISEVAVYDIAPDDDGMAQGGESNAGIFKRRSLPGQ